MQMFWCVCVNENISTYIQCSTLVDSVDKEKKEEPNNHVHICVSTHKYPEYLISYSFEDPSNVMT